MASPASIAVLESVYSTVDGQVREILGKRARVRPATINFEWPGGGSSVSVSSADPLLVEIPFPCQVRSAHLYAMDATGAPVVVTSCTVDVQMSSFEGFGGSTPLYGTGTIPTLTAESSADLDLTGWHRLLIVGDTLIARIATLSGAVRAIVLCLRLVPTDVPTGVGSVVDDGGDQVTDNAGNAVDLRT